MRCDVTYGKLAGLAAVLAVSSLAQDVISARSGLIHYTEGEVSLNDKAVARKAAEFPAMKEGDDLRTSQGRVEVLLTPGVFLRMAENSGVRMVRNQLMDTKLQLLAGSALLEVGELEKGQALTMALGNTTVEFNKKGLFRLDADPAQIRVYDGQAVVVSGDQQVTVKEGRQAALSAAVIDPVKFDKDDDVDSFYLWASRRSSYIAMANISAAKQVHDGLAFRGSNGWIYNSYLGMFTYLPFNGLYRSPFGWSYYSPGAVARVYYRPPVQIYSPSSPAGMMGPSARGMSDMGGRSMGSYGGGSMAAPPPMSSAPAAPAAGPRGGGSGGGSRGGGSGR